VSEPANDMAAVIVTWNSAAVVKGCLRSLRAATEGLSVDTVVVDNGSHDDTLAIVSASDPGVRIISNRNNRGLAAANNQGIQATSAPYVLIANPDVVFGRESVSRLLDLLVRRPRVAWVVPRLTYEDGSPQTSAGELPGLLEALAGRQVARWLSRRGRRTYWWDGQVPAEETRIGRGHEAAYIVRRESVDEVGLQDERYVLDWEGFDWAERFTRAGWEIWMAPQAEVVHLGGTSIRTVPFRWIASQHRGMYLYFADREARHWKPALAVAFTVRALTKMTAVAVGVPMYQRAHRSPDQSSSVR
jgi:N-acetylglucosaminyl-diphospho-decaprenol L-rhamnosyltransferase